MRRLLYTPSNLIQRINTFGAWVAGEPYDELRSTPLNRVSFHTSPHTNTDSVLLEPRWKPVGDEDQGRGDLLPHMRRMRRTARSRGELHDLRDEARRPRRRPRARERECSAENERGIGPRALALR